jgi:transposase
VLKETQDREEIIERVAALDIGKAELVACVRVPSADRAGRRAQEIATYSTMTRSLLGLADRLRVLGVTRVVMEATSDYWKPVVRHEALGNRAGVRGLRCWSVAAGW